MSTRRKGELREATESLIISLNVEIDSQQGYIDALKKERDLLRKKLEEDEGK
jgi:hypothetical protein